MITLVGSLQGRGQGGWRRGDFRDIPPTLGFLRLYVATNISRVSLDVNSEAFYMELQPKVRSKQSPYDSTAW